MSKTMAVLSSTGIVENIVIYEDSEPETENLVTYTEENPAYIGGDYVAGCFYPPQPFDSWTRQEGKWIAPTPKPTDGFTYYWNESELAWELIDFSEPEA